MFPKQRFSFPYVLVSYFLTSLILLGRTSMEIRIKVGGCKRQLQLVEGFKFQMHLSGLIFFLLNRTESCVVKLFLKMANL